MKSMELAQPVTQKIAGLGASLHGGRPTFALRKQEDTFTLYELLPENQAFAHKRRWESNRRLSKRVKLEDLEFLDDTEWDWNDWMAVKIARLGRTKFENLRTLVKELLQETEHSYADLLHPEDRTLLLPEPIGVKLALAFIGIKPLQRVDKQRAIIQQLEKMSTEECYYWHSLCRSPSTPNGGKALRTLLIGDL